MSAGQFLLEYGPLIYAAAVVPLLAALTFGIAREVWRDHRRTLQRSVQSMHKPND